MAAGDGVFWDDVNSGQVVSLKLVSSSDGPVFEHDCDNCTYLLTAEFRGKQADVYECKGGLAIISNRVFRFSDEPSDYTTMFESVVLRLELDLNASQELLSLSGAKTIPNTEGGTPIVVQKTEG
ncbi:MAG: hypothetical protein G01um101420_543 [Parcubacteria group bacterium Gr01-1014_20]|nr:MAG: hypothetical protein G01um101420_543 [Parcubacteria group bacterium Gr01-1014_20]